MEGAKHKGNCDRKAAMDPRKGMQQKEAWERGVDWGWMGQETTHRSPLEDLVFSAFCFSEKSPQLRHYKVTIKLGAGEEEENEEQSHIE